MPKPAEQIRDGESLSETHELDCLVNTLHNHISSQISDSPLAIRISGFGSLGKSTLAKKLSDSFNSVPIIETDGYMLDREERRIRNLPNGDNPNVIDFSGMENAVLQLLAGNSVDDLTYNHHNGKHEIKGKLLPSNLIIIEGASALYDELNLDIPSISIFLDAENDLTKINLRHQINITERGYTPEQSEKALPNYLAAYKTFIAPSKNNADIVITVTDQRPYQTNLITQCTCVK